MTEQELTKIKMVLDNIYFHLTKDDFPFSLNDLEYQKFLEVIEMFKTKEQKLSDDLNSKLNLLFKNRDWESIVELLSKLIKLHPNNVEYLYDRGVAYFRLFKKIEAIEDFTKVIELYPAGKKTSKAYRNRGISYKSIHDYVNVFLDLTKAIELDPSDFSIYYDRGNAHLDIADFNEGIEDLTKVIESNMVDTIYCNRSDCYWKRGKAYYELNKYDEALSDYTQAVELDPDGFCFLVNKIEELKEILKEKQNA